MKRNPFLSHKKSKFFGFFYKCLVLIPLLLLLILELGNNYSIAHQELSLNTTEIEKLLNRLNLNKPGLEEVKKLKDQPGKAANQLLNYYRSRSFVEHPIDSELKDDKLGDCATEKDIKVANDALEHILVGQPSYPAHFCGEDIDWSTQPVSDKEWVWQLNRMSFWSAMGRAYWHTGKEKYAGEWAEQLIDWVEDNPRDGSHEYAWRSIEAGIRGHRWTNLFQRFLDAPSFTPAVLVTFLNSLYDHASYLMTQYSKGSNWALMEAEGLAFIAMTFPEFEDSEEWRDEAIARFNKEIKNQVYPDGHQRELAWGYHMGSVGWFLRTYNLAKMNGQANAFPESYLQTVEKMCEVPVKLGFPDGSNPQFGDSWTGEPGENWDELKKWAQIFDREDFLYVATNGKKGSRPDKTAFALEESGLYPMRSGWNKDDICLVLKCGPDGGYHCQPDNGTFELYAGGRHLMPDAGSYIYSGNPEARAWFRQTKVHQTLTLDGKNSTYAPNLLLWDPGIGVDKLVVENASYQNLTHRRAVFFVDQKFFVILDEAYGEATGNVDIHFQLAPGEASYDFRDFTVNSDFDEGWNVLVKSQNSQNMKLQKEKGQVSFEYTKKQPRPAFRYRVFKEEKERGVRFVTVVAPYQGSKPEITTNIIGDPEIGGSHMELEVKTDEISKHIGYDLNQ